MGQRQIRANPRVHWGDSSTTSENADEHIQQLGLGRMVDFFHGQREIGEHWGKKVGARQTVA